MSEHTPITGELREAVEWEPTFCGPDRAMVPQPEFDCICDAIDAVHAGLERENAELRELLAVLDNERGDMHDGWVRLPLDADGVPLHIGELVDEMLPFGGYAAPAPIDTMELYRGASGYGWMVKLDAENSALISPNLLRHHHAPTVEDVLREMHAELDEVTALYVGEAIDSDERDRDEARIFAEYAKRLTLAGDAE
jgi:hypothetical protein